MQDRLIFVALPFLVVLCMIGAFIMVWSGGRWEERPWWQNPLLWLSIGVGCVIAGVFTWPGLFVGPFVVLPLVWKWRPHRRPPVDPRTNGHSPR